MEIFTKIQKLLVFVIIILILPSCKEECLKGQDKRDYIKKCYSASVSQTKTAMAAGTVSVTFNNECNDYYMTITQIGIGIRAFAGLGGKSTKTRKGKFIVPPNSSVVRTYDLDIGDKVRNAYALESGIEFCQK